MAFSDLQMRKLARALERRHIRERQADGRSLHYLEGWHVISEANRIFGFDAWDRETISSQCVWQKQVGYRFSASYLIRVRISVRAGDTIVIREGLGSGEAVSPTAGQAHELASKAAETDATKRALSTFGNPFGLSLYGSKAKGRGHDNDCAVSDAPVVSNDSRSQSTRETNGAQRTLASHCAEDLGASNEFPKNRPVGYVDDGSKQQSVDKSVLALGEPKRHRDKEHLRFVASRACVVCGQGPCHAHHVRISQPRALGCKVSDEFTVPLCALHHRELHARGDERAWWHDQKIDPLPLAYQLWTSAREPRNIQHRM